MSERHTSQMSERHSQMGGRHTRASWASAIHPDERTPLHSAVAPHPPTAPLNTSGSNINTLSSANRLIVTAYSAPLARPRPAPPTALAATDRTKQSKQTEPGRCTTPLPQIFARSRLSVILSWVERSRVRYRGGGPAAGGRSCCRPPSVGVIISGDYFSQNCVATAAAARTHNPASRVSLE